MSLGREGHTQRVNCFSWFLVEEILVFSVQLAVCQNWRLFSYSFTFPLLSNLVKDEEVFFYFYFTYKEKKTVSLLSLRSNDY